MPIKWSALEVSDAMDMVEQFNEQAAEPFEQAKIVAAEARKIANLQQYVDERLVRIITDIERIDYIRGAIKAVRDSLPDGAAEDERKRLENGRQLSLVAQKCS
jgi:hypothetical protein